MPNPRLPQKTRQENNEFEERLERGQAAESDIALWFKQRGCKVLPIYDIQHDTNKGPQLFAKDFECAAPDLLVFTDGGEIWIEAKLKTVFSWYRTRGRWVTGIDIRLYEDYQKIFKEVKHVPIWLLFLHQSKQPDARDIEQGCPSTCPVGLFGNSLDVLTKTESHRSKKYGMVYWGHEDLKLLAQIDNQGNPFDETSEGGAA